MAHVRKQIRDALATLLTSNVAAVSGRVFTSRVYPLTNASLPAIGVHTNSESAALMTMGVKTYDRELSISVDCYVSATDTYAGDVDDLSVAIREAVAKDTTLSGIVKTIFPINMEIEFSGDTESPVAVGRLTFAARYVTSITDVETAR